MSLRDFETRLLASAAGKWLGKYVNIERILHGLFWVSIGNALASAASFASSLVLARSLGAGVFGQFSVLQGTLAVFMVLSGPSLGYMATKYIAEFRYSSPLRTSSILKLSMFSVSGVSAVTAIALLVATPYIAHQILRAPWLMTELYLSAGIVFFTGVNAAQLGALSGFEAFKEVAIINILKGVLTFPLVVLGGRSYGVLGAIGGLLAVSIFSCAFSDRYVVSLRRVNNLPSVVLSDALAEAKLLLSFSLPNWLFAMVTSVSNIWVYVMLSRTANGYAQVGVFNAANQFFLLLNFLAVIVWQVSFPMLSGLSGRGEFARLRHSYRKLVAINVAALAVLLTLAFPFSQIIMNRLGEDYIGQKSILMATVLLALVYVSVNVAWQIMLVLGRIWTALLFVAIHACVYVSTFNLLKADGAYGLAVARLVSYFIYAVLTIGYVERELKRKIKQGVA